MSRVEVELEHDNIRAFLRSESVGKLMKSYADKAAERLGEGYEADEKVMATRAIASVFTATDEAKRENMENNSILKAVLEK